MRTSIIKFVLILAFSISAKASFSLSISGDSSWQAVGTKGFTNTLAQGTSLVCDHSDTLYLASTPGSAGLLDVMKFDGNNWISTGLTQLNITNASDLSFSVSPSNEPCLAFMRNSAASVVRFDGASWHYIGPENITSSDPSSTGIAFDSAGTAYLAFVEGYDPPVGSVMKYNGTDWEYVGQRGFFDSCYVYISLTVSPEGEPWVAGLMADKLTILKYDSTGWSQPGPCFGNDGYIFGKALIKFNSAGKPFVVYTTKDVYNLEVVTWVYDHWEPLYYPFNNGLGEQSDNYSMDFNASGEPCIAYTNTNNFHKTAVKKAHGGWENIGPNGFSDGGADFPSIVFNSQGHRHDLY
jgi:hypothetical protein